MKAEARTIVVRPALERDIADIIALERSTPELAHWNEAQYAAMLAVDDGPLAQSIFVAESDGSLAGFIAGRYLDGELTAEIEALAVARDRRRQKVALILLGVFSKWASVTCGAEGLSLEVRQSNSGAMTFYERMGFFVSGVRTAYYSEPVEDAVVLLKEFAQARGSGAF